MGYEGDTIFRIYMGGRKLVRSSHVVFDETNSLKQQDIAHDDDSLVDLPQDPETFQPDESNVLQLDLVDITPNGGVEDTQNTPALAQEEPQLPELGALDEDDGQDEDVDQAAQGDDIVHRDEMDRQLVAKDVLPFANDEPPAPPTPRRSARDRTQTEHGASYR